MSSRSWLSYYYQSRFHLTPLSYEPLEYAAGFSSEQCPEGVVAISTNTLRILALEKLGAVFNQVAFPLEYTPRKFVVHPDTSKLIILETEHNAYTEETKRQRRQQMAEVCKLVVRVPGFHPQVQVLVPTNLLVDVCMSYLLFTLGLKERVQLTVYWPFSLLWG